MTTPSPSHHGVIDADFAFDERAGRTTLATLHTASPIRLSPALPKRDGGVELFVTECSPGLLPGDRYDLHWRLGPGARVRARTQSALRVHGRGDGADAPASRLIQRIDVGADACFELVPEPVVLHRGAHLDSQVEVTIAKGGAALVADIFTAGRVARAEVFEFRRLRACVSIRLEGRLVAASSQQLEPSTLPEVAAPGLLGGATHWASMYVVAGAVDGDGWDALRAELDALTKHDPAVDACVDLLGGDAGLAVVATALDAHSLQQLCAVVARRIDLRWDGAHRGRSNSQRGHAQRGNGATQ